jgi:SAM-dependent methyltransferase
MEERHRESAERVRALIERGLHDPAGFRAALLDVPAVQRDAWLDLVLGLGELPDDSPELPRGCVPYLPCPVDDLLQIVEHAPVHGSDLFVDVGSGVGRAAALVHLLTGASAFGLEIQPGLARSAQTLSTRLLASRLRTVAGDAAELIGTLAAGTVFLLYCPFGGERLARTLAALEATARKRTIRVCCVDLPLPPCSWLTLEASPRAGLQIYRSGDSRAG